MSIAPDRTTPILGEPAWDIARLFPAQGSWDEWDYFALDTNRLVEFSDGIVEVLPMPTMSHQQILAFLFGALKAFAEPAGLGTVVLAGLPVRIAARKYRQPDIVFMLAEHAERTGEQFWDGADLVMEIVSEGGRSRDLETKRSEYASAGIPEYWIVDPRDQRITVLALEEAAYAVVGEFGLGERAESRLMPGFSVDVSEALAGAL